MSRMLRAVDLAVSIKGTQNIGPGVSSLVVTCRSVSSVKRIGFPLWAQLESTLTDSLLFCSLPYTMGVAIASTAHAAKNRSPVLTVIS